MITSGFLAMKWDYFCYILAHMSSLCEKGQSSIQVESSFRNGWNLDCNGSLGLGPSSRATRRRLWHPTPVLLPGKSHGQRSLVGCSPRGRKESDTTEAFTFHLHALEKGTATHSSVLAWRIPGMVEPGGLPSMESHRVGHDWRDLAAAAGGVRWYSHHGKQCGVSFKN